MSYDHKPEDEVELVRIKNAGGKVTMDGRVNGGLNLSRAIGGWLSAEYSLWGICFYCCMSNTRECMVWSIRMLLSLSCCQVTTSIKGTSRCHQRSRWFLPCPTSKFSLWTRNMTSWSSPVMAYGELKRFQQSKKSIRSVNLSCFKC